MTGPVFFTTRPPVPYPFVVSYGQIPYFATELIVDTKISQLFTGELYSDKFIQDQFALAKAAPDRMHVAIPDYPPLAFERGTICNYDNIDETLRIQARARQLNLRGIYTIQTQSKSIFEDLDFIREYNVPEGSWVGIGGQCTKVNLRYRQYISSLVMSIRREYPNHHVHFWGMSIWFLHDIKGYIDSFDSCKWTRYLFHRSCSVKNRGCYFAKYLERIAEILR